MWLKIVPRAMAEGFTRGRSAGNHMFSKTSNLDVCHMLRHRFQKHQPRMVEAMLSRRIRDCQDKQKEVMTNGGEHRTAWQAPWLLNLWQNETQKRDERRLTVNCGHFEVGNTIFGFSLKEVF